MAITSTLEDFSLVELFRMIDQGRKSGRLTLFSSSPDQCSEPKTCYYIWFRHGRVVAASKSLEGKGLTAKIVAKGWLSQRVVERLDSLAPAGTPLGLTLKTQGALQVDQLNLLFTDQMQQIWRWFSIRMGHFHLDGKATLPATEMTGLSLSAMDVALGGLRALKNWHALTEALPETSAGIQSIIQGKPQRRLSSLEWQIWEFANGTVAIDTIAQQLNQSTAKVQQAVFRLMLAGLVEDIPLVTPDLGPMNFSIPLPVFEQPLEVAVAKGLEAPRVSAEVSKPQVSNSFLQNLVGFLRSKA